ncbi:MAG: hypothetical protein U7123_12535 [Potamolinea sp.]
MKNLISLAIAQITSLFNGVQFKRFFAVVLVGFILLTTNVDSKQNNNALSTQVREQANQIDSVRPKTTNDWYKEARETENSPGKRLENIAEETVEAIKEFGAVYPDTAKRSAPVLQEHQDS